MRQLPLSQGLFAIVDDDDFARLSAYKWSASRGKMGNMYAVRRTTRAKGVKPKILLLHREVLGLSTPPPFVDHINHNGLDNRKENLRIVTHLQNCLNTRSRKGTSLYKGVSFDSSRRKWKVQIKAGDKHLQLGRFKNEHFAAIVYDVAALKHFGEFAVLNYPQLVK